MEGENDQHKGWRVLRLGSDRESKKARKRKERKKR